MNAQLQQKQENLTRLKTALAQLLNCEGEFHYNKGICLNPSLSKKTWNGSMANDFDVFKQRELQESFQSIKDRDLQQVISRLEAEIEKIKQEIFSLESNRSSQQSRLNELHRQRRMELLK
jgi:outer membrane lipopolysaccharide assembly protein LptE/RlpB